MNQIDIILYRNLTIYLGLPKNKKQAYITGRTILKIA